MAIQLENIGYLQKRRRVKIRL